MIEKAGYIFSRKWTTKCLSNVSKNKVHLVFCGKANNNPQQVKKRLRLNKRLCHKDDGTKDCARIASLVDGDVLSVFGDAYPTAGTNVKLQTFGPEEQNQVWRIKTI